MKTIMGSFFKVIGFITIVFLIISAGGLLFAGYWLQAGDKIVKADAIFILGGSYLRPSYAGELYVQGYASTIYVGRSVYREDDYMIRKAGVNLPPQEEIYRRLLIEKGVPENAVEFFGKSLINTVDEAKALKKVIGNKSIKLILVTSPYHVRRAKMIFEDILPTCTILATGTPYESFPRKWWSTRISALKTINETIKILFYLMGGQFESDDVPASSVEKGVSHAENTGSRRKAFDLAIKLIRCPQKAIVDVFSTG